MPVYNQGFFGSNQPQHQPQALAQLGPIFQVQVAIPTPLEQLLTSQNQQVPLPVSGIALIDTGATRSAVDTQAISALGLSQIGVVPLGTAQGPTQAPLFPARFIIAAGTPAQIVIEFSSVVGVNLDGQVILGQNVIALIGRDVLSRCIFVYNGTLGEYTLAL